MSEYSEINTTSLNLAWSVIHWQHVMSPVEYSGMGQIFISGVASIAARALGSAKICVPRGSEQILPREVHGSCKNTKRGELLQSTRHLLKLDVATLDFCRLICLKETKVSCWVLGFLPEGVMPEFDWSDLRLLPGVVGAGLPCPGRFPIPALAGRPALVGKPPRPRETPRTWVCCDPPRPGCPPN